MYKYLNTNNDEILFNIPYIGDEQINQAAEQYSPSKNDRIVKISLMHHSLINQDVVSNDFYDNPILDSGRILKRLSSYGINLALCGHKHKDTIYLSSVSFPNDKKSVLCEHNTEATTVYLSPSLFSAAGKGNHLDIGHFTFIDLFERHYGIFR